MAKDNSRQAGYSGIARAGEPTMNNAQTSELFFNIAAAADNISNLCAEAVDGGDQAENFAAAARDLANQVGWMADIGAKAFGGVALKGTDAREWLLSPSYHNAAKADA